VTDPDPPRWTGDPADEQTLEWRGFRGHVEDMGRGWFCSVWRESDRGTVFQSADAGILPLTGDAARRLCELAIRAETGG
jgi:hypothetical protein